MTLRLPKKLPKMPATPLAPFLEEYKLGTVYHDPLAPWAERWHHVHTLQEACQVMVEWLQGKWPCHPFYKGRPPKETQELADALLYLNQHHFLTKASQPGRRYGKVQQRAYVKGWLSVEDALKVSERLTPTDLYVLTVKPGAKALNSGEVSKSELANQFPLRRAWGKPAPDHRQPRRADHLRYRAGAPSYHPGLSPSLERCLDEEAVWVTVADPEWERRYTLWAKLAEALE